MATGFVQRIKGKTTGDLYVAGNLGVRQNVQIIKVGVQSTTIQNSGVTILTSTVGAAVIALDAPVSGVEKTIVVSTMSSGTIVVKTNSTGVTFFDGVNGFWKPSTSVGTSIAMALVGLSSVQWQQLGISVSTAAASAAGLGLTSAGT